MRKIWILCLSGLAFSSFAQPEWTHDIKLTHINIVPPASVYISDIRGNLWLAEDGDATKNLWKNIGDAPWTVVDGKVIVCQQDSILLMSADNTEDVPNIPTDFRCFPQKQNSMAFITEDSLYFYPFRAACRIDKNATGVNEIISYENEVLLLADSCIHRVCHENMDKRCFDFTITTALPFDKGLLIAFANRGLWYLESGRLRRFFMPGLRFPENIKSIYKTENYLWILDDTHELYVYITDKQTIELAASGVTDFDVDHWRVLWYITGNTLHKNHKWKNDLLPVTTISSIENNYTKHDTHSGSQFAASDNNILIRLNGKYSPASEDLNYYYRVNEGPWMDNGAQPEIRLTSLSPGKYHVRARSSADGRYFSNIVDYKFGIRSPLYSSFWFYAFMILLLFILLALFFLGRLKRSQILLEKESHLLRYRLELSDQKQKLAQMQMNPHFIFNALNSISGLISIGENQQARKALRDFSGIMRSQLDSGARDYISLKSELEFLKSYLELEKICRDNKFDYYISSTVDEDFCIPALMVQPIAENAIKHGFKGLKRQGILKIDFTKQDNYIRVEISDNGSGRKELMPETMDGRPHATDIITQRLRIIGKWIDKEPIEYIEGRGDTAGTTVILRLPFKTQSDVQ